MSIKSAKVYLLECDDCGKTLKWPGQPFDFTSEYAVEVMNAARRDEWWEGIVPDENSYFGKYDYTKFVVICPDCKEKRGIA